jgi:hypothetical protein
MGLDYCIEFLMMFGLCSLISKIVLSQFPFFHFSYNSIPYSAQVYSVVYFQLSHRGLTKDHIKYNHPNVMERQDYRLAN